MSELFLVIILCFLISKLILKLLINNIFWWFVYISLIVDVSDDKKLVIL